ncbi:MAG: hypothetical protein GDA40_10320 [Rhodobacteraceae bacterium]|nr:hypothetical protein [Paracoccaceae bacterium]
MIVDHIVCFPRGQWRGGDDKEIVAFILARATGDEQNANRISAGLGHNRDGELDFQHAAGIDLNLVSVDGCEILKFAIGVGVVDQKRLYPIANGVAGDRDGPMASGWIFGQFDPVDGLIEMGHTQRRGGRAGPSAGDEAFPGSVSQSGFGQC